MSDRQLSAESAGRRCDGGMNPWPCPTCGDGACHFPEKPAPSRDPRCDCQQPEEINGMRGISNSCPVHNDCPDPPWPDSAVTATVAQGSLTQEDIYANCWTTLIGFSEELTERDRKFICDQVARKVILAAQPPAAPVDPVAYRVKDFADGWILCHTLEVAEHEADGQCLIQPLYAGAIPFSRPQCSAVSAEDIARTIALSYGRDPDALTEWTEMCDAHNRPVPIWKVYEEQAEALLASYSITRPHRGPAEPEGRT